VNIPGEIEVEVILEIALRDGAADIQNTDNNCTRFIVISREAVLPEDAEKISLCFSLPHTPGSLCHTLERFALLGLNLTKIESRPSRSAISSMTSTSISPGNVHDVQTLALICALSDETRPVFRPFLPETTKKLEVKKD